MFVLPNPYRSYLVNDEADASFELFGAVASYSMARHGVLNWGPRTIPFVLDYDRQEDESGQYDRNWILDIGHAPSAEMDTYTFATEQEEEAALRLIAEAVLTYTYELKKIRSRDPHSHNTSGYNADRFMRNRDEYWRLSDLRPELEVDAE